MPVKQFSLAVAICGALDIAYAIVTAMMKGGTAAGVLRAVASGPFGEAATTWGAGGAILGLAVHFVIMAMMVAVYFVLVRNTRLATLSPWIVGIGYGLMLYLVMYFIVLPLRWPTVHPLTDPAKIFLSLLPHIALVGIPLAFIGSRRSAMLAASIDPNRFRV